MPRKKIPEGEPRKSPPRKPPGIWEQEIGFLLETEMRHAKVDVPKLAAILKAMGYSPPSETALRVRLARGTFSAGFLLMVLRALNCDVLDVSEVSKHERKPHVPSWSTDSAE